MDKVVRLLEEELSAGLESVILSNPREKNGIFKIKVRPVVIKNILHFQKTEYIENKVLHQNLKKEELAEYILRMLEASFGQMELESASVHANVLVSKKGTVTVKIKKKQMQGAAASCIEADDLSHNRSKKYILTEGIPVDFLIDLGVQNKEGRIVKAKYDKYRQINRYLEFIRDTLPHLPKGKKLTVIDFGCGKSYLTFAMYYYLKIMNGYEVDMIGLDLKEDVIQTCNQLRDKYGYSDLRFLQGDIQDYHATEEVDMVVTLHACDTATDYALAKAVRWRAKVILSVPCCQHELNGQISCDILRPVLKYGLLKERMSALLTDGIRANLLEEAGYEVQVLEFIDMEHTPKNILIRGVRKSGFAKRPEKIAEMLEFLHANPTMKHLLEACPEG